MTLYRSMLNVSDAAGNVTVSPELISLGLDKLAEQIKFPPVTASYTPTATTVPQPDGVGVGKLPIATALLMIPEVPVDAAVVPLVPFQLASELARV